MQEKTVDSVMLRKQMDRPKLFDTANIILLLALAIAIFWIVKLSRDQATLKRSMRSMSAVEGELAGPQSCQVGDIIPSFRSLTPSGKPVEVAYDGTSKYLQFLFSPMCGTCREEISTLNKLAPRFQESGYQVIGISIDPIDESRQYMKDLQFAFEVVVMPSMAMRRTYRVVSVPQTMLVSSQGRVEWVHYGGLTDENTAEMLSRISK